MMNPEEENAEVCLVGQDLTELSLVEYGAFIRRIDLSFNCLVSLRGLHICADTLEELILDNNLLERVDFRADFPNLHTLSLNKNRVVDIDTLIQELSRRVKNIRHLSLHGNPICPDQLSNNLVEEKDYQLYRCHILHHLRNIRFLDHGPVSLSELKESRKSFYAKIKIVPPYTPLPPSNYLYSHSHAHPVSTPAGRDELSVDIGDDQSTLENRPNSSNPSSSSSSSSHYHQHHNNTLSAALSPVSQNYNHLGQKRQGGGPTETRVKGRTGKRKFRYVGKNSEGNRFIKDADL